MSSGTETPPPSAPRPPDDAEELRGFPRVSVDDSGYVWRAHRRGYGPWFFGAKGRFGLDYPHGTCYVAMDPLTAISETAIRGQAVLQHSDLDDWMIRRMPLSTKTDLADFMDRKAAGYGVTRDICSGGAYETSRMWGRALLSISYGGVRYWARHDSGVSAAALALFGRHGERRGWRRGRGELLSSPEWVQKIRMETGVEVLPDAGDDSDLEFVDAPPEYFD